MSDNEDDGDERLDRAKRIRRMREGGRDDDSDDSESGDIDQTDDTDSADDSSEVTGGDETEGTGEETGEAVDENEEVEWSEETVAVEESEETVAGEKGEETVAGEKSGADPEVEGADLPDEESELGDLTAGTDEEDISAPLPETDQLEEALEEADADTETDGVAPEEVADTEADTPDEGEDEEDTRVLEFALEEEYYCLDIEYIEEIVKEETITRVPNTPDFVEGVVDLRGQITTIINPKVTIGKENTEAGGLIIVFDSEAFEDQGHIGWVVDDVRQVSPITDSEVNEPPVDEEYINGVIDREDDDQFVIWTTPEMALDVTETESATSG